MSIENIEELEEALDELFPGGFSIETNKHGELVIYSGLKQDEDGILSPLDSEEDEEVDPDLEPLGDEDLGDDE